MYAKSYANLPSPGSSDRKQFVKPWIKASIGSEPQTIEDLIKAFPAESLQLHAMQRDGIVLEPAVASCDLPLLVTTDPAIAAKYDMLPEHDYWNEQEAASE